MIDVDEFFTAFFSSMLHPDKLENCQVSQLVDELIFLELNIIARNSVVDMPPWLSEPDSN